MPKHIVSLFAICVLAATFAVDNAHARIYKTVDEEGNVVFTDVPPKDQSKAIEVDTKNLYTAPTVPTVVLTDDATQDGEEEQAEPATVYESLAITSPENDIPLRENAGNVTITVDSVPEIDIASGHVVQILLDGQILATGTSANVGLTDVDRGTHSIIARIIDADGEVLISSTPVSFHMLRAFRRT